MIKFFIIFFLLISTASYATFTDLTNLGSGAKNIALGKTQSTDQTPYSIFANPAGISGIDRMAIASMYSSVLDDINYSILGLAIPIKDGSVRILLGLLEPPQRLVADLLERQTLQILLLL